MFGTLQNYLSNVERAWQVQDGHNVAAFLSLKDKHIMNRNLYIQSPEYECERILDSQIAEIVSSHLKVLFYLGSDGKLTISFDFSL